MALAAANFGRVDKYCVHTAQDHAVGLGLQKRMVRAAGITHTATFNSSHCPFLSVPGQVSELLLMIGQQ